MENQFKDCNVCGAQRENMIAIWNSFICENCEQEVEDHDVIVN